MPQFYARASLRQRRSLLAWPTACLTALLVYADTHDVDIRLTFVELYKEEFLDLLSGDVKNTVTLREPKSGDWCLCGAREVKARAALSQPPSPIRARALDRLHLSGVPLVPPVSNQSSQVNTIGDFVDALSQGVAQRATAETRMNISSSRSHAVLTINVRTEPLGGGACARWSV